MIFRLSPLLIGACFSPTGLAGELHATPDDYRPVLRRLQPGDTVQLASGTYGAGLPLRGLQGAPGQPISIVGPKRGEALFVAAPGRNTISILNSAHVVVKNLVLDGQNLAVDGVKCEGHADFAHHITLENLTIRGHGNNQQTVGISTKCPAWNWVIRNNVIEGAGTGMYLGNSDGSAPFVAGLIEHNLIIDSIGYSLQIKHQAARPGLAGMPTAPRETVIRHNVFAKTAPLREGAQARPSVLVGHWPKAGAGADDRYLIYGNFFYGATVWGGGAESLFQGEGNIALYNNLFVAPDGDAIRIQPHNDIPKYVVVSYNTVLARGAGIVLSRGERPGAYEQLVSHNAVFAGQPLAGGEAALNVLGPLGQAARYLTAPTLGVGGLNLRPRPDALRLQDRSGTGLPGADVDFDGARRDPHVAGAYAESAKAPRWPPKLERKPRP